MRQKGYTADQLDRVLNHASGLKGISGIMTMYRSWQRSHKIIAGNNFAQDMYVHRLRSCIGAMLASSGGLDTFGLTAGVGENSALVRTAACEAFGF